MTLRTKSRKILIPDVSPAIKTTITHQGVVIAGIGVFCVSLVVVAVLLVFLGA